MSEYFTLENPEEIGSWMDLNYPIYCLGRERKAMTPSELLEYKEEEQPDQLTDGNHYYGVVRTVYTADDWPLITLERVFVAKSAEEALAGYVFGPSKHMSGRGSKYLGVILRTNRTDRPQDINVFRLAEGTDSFY